MLGSRKLSWFLCLLQLLHADNRREYLYQLQEFMVTDNSRNWRFRYELAEYVSFASSSWNDVFT